MVKTKKLSGFTLIELMVVIAIIGMLAAVVTVGLGKARNAARDSKIKSDVTQAATEGELIMADTNSYDSLCSSAHNSLGTSTAYSLSILQSDINSQSPGGAATMNCWADDNHYCIEVKLNNGNYFCRDSDGRALDGATVSNCSSASSTCVNK